MREGKYFDSTNNIPLKDGNVVEKEALGEVNDAIEYKEFIKSGIRLEREKAFENVRGRQPKGPFMPATDFASQLRSKFIEQLSNNEDVDMKKINRVKFYTAVGSIADYQWSTDAFFEIEPPNENDETRIITMDVKTNPNEESGADIVFLFPPKGLDSELDKEQFNGTVQRVLDGLIEKYIDPSRYINKIHYVTKEDLYELE